MGDGIILDTSRMDRIWYRDGVVFAGPGARLGAVTRLLSGHGRILGPNPSVGPYCSVGGMVATNASGSLSLGYGSIIDNLESVTLVDGRGDVVELPSNRYYSDTISGICRRAGPFPGTVKNSCGYRLDAVSSPGMSHRVVAASEGTLGVVVGARLRTYPAPRRRVLGSHAVCGRPFGGGRLPPYFGVRTRLAGGGGSRHNGGVRGVVRAVCRVSRFACA